MYQFCWLNPSLALEITRVRVRAVMNRVRVEAGLTQLSMSDVLNKCAKLHTRDQIKRMAISNLSSNGDTLQQRLMSVDYAFSTASEVTFISDIPIHRLHLILSRRSICKILIEPTLQQFGVYCEKCRKGKFHWTLIFTSNLN